MRGPQASPTGAPAPGGPEQLGQTRSEGRKGGGGGRAEEASGAARSGRRLRRGGGDEAGGAGRGGGGAVGDAPPLLGLAFFSFRTARVSASLPGAG